MKIKSMFTLVAAMITTSLFSQITTGSISYDAYLSSDNPQFKQMLGQMEESSTVDMYFTDGKLRTDMVIPNFSTTNTIAVKEEENGLMLMDNSFLGKIAIVITSEDKEKQQEQSDKVDVKLIDGETKKILGYDCKKAIISVENQGEFELWYTEEIVPEIREGQFLYEEIKGLPLEMTTKMMGMDIKLEAYSFKDKLSKKQKENLFSLEIPKGYTVKTFEDLRMMGGGR
ncbi:MAG: DUF4412 domain-containing protein [Brumimicrobium sp.]